MFWGDIGYLYRNTEYFADPDLIAHGLEGG